MVTMKKLTVCMHVHLIQTHKMQITSYTKHTVTQKLYYYPLLLQTQLSTQYTLTYQVKLYLVKFGYQYLNDTDASGESVTPMAVVSERECPTDKL